MFLFNFYKENAVREWSFKRAITIQTYDGYDPIPVPLNIIYIIFKPLIMRRVKKDETDVSVMVVAYSWQRDSLIILQLINILIPYGSLLFFPFNGQM